MKVSHETPKCLLSESRNFNDYDYALVHLFDEDKDYKQFFVDSLKNNRVVYLDNSLFELETMFDHEKFAKEVENLGKHNPNNFYYIVPDSLEEKDKTIQSYIEFTEKYPDLPGKKIGVVQGKTLDELVECYRFMSERTDMVAISFDYSWYQKQSPNEKTKYHSWMKGRQFFIQYLMQNNIWCSKPHHLLGCSLPQEFKQYDIENIVSVDTSNPVVHAILGIKYSENGLQNKESIKLVDLFGTDCKKIDLSVLEYNIKKFREFSNAKF